MLGPTTFIHAFEGSNPGTPYVRSIGSFTMSQSVIVVIEQKLWLLILVSSREPASTSLESALART